MNLRKKKNTVPAALVSVPLSWLTVVHTADVKAVFLFILISAREILNPQRHMNGNVTSHMWHQITNQIPEW